MAERQFNIVVNVDTKSADRKLNSFEKELKKTQKELQNLGSSVSTSNLTKFGNAANDTTKDVKKLDASADSLGSSMGSLSGDIGGLEAALGGSSSGMLDLAQTALLVNTGFLDFTKNIEESAVAYEKFNLGMAGAEVGITRTDERLDQVARANLKAKKALIATRVAIVALGVAAVLAAGQIAKLESQLITLSGVDPTTFQLFSNAAAQFGLNADQTANILKDFNDRIGDFIVTGGGPLADVMERLSKQTNLTADALVGMSGPEGLVAIKKAMDDANLSMQEQVFILESLGSDLTLLLPLLKDNGAALKDFSDDWVNLAAVTSQGSLTDLTSLSNEWAKSLDLVKAAFLGVAAEAAPLLEGLLNLLNKAIAGIINTVKLANAQIKIMGASVEELFGNHEEAAKLREEVNKIFDSIAGLNSEVKDTTKNSEALYKLQGERAAKVNTEIQKQIANQTALAQAAGVSAAAYALELSYQTRLTAEETKRKELQKLGLRPEQIQALVEQYDILALAIKHTSDELARRQTIEGITKSQEDQLELLKARNDEERRWIELQQQIGDTALSPEEQKRIESLHAQILAQEELNRVTQETKDAYEDLGSAVTQAMLGSEDAIVSVIAQLIKLIALANGFDQNPFTQGLLSGLGGYADGGSFNAGETFMVGERGPEIITASAAGRVIPNHELGSSSSGFNQNISLSINGSIVASEELDRKFEEFAGAVADNTSNLLRNQMRTGGTLR